MYKKLDLQKWLLVFTIAVMTVGASSESLHGQDDLKIRMEKIGVEFGGGKLTESQMEGQYAVLQNEAKSPGEKGRIYKHLAYTFAVRTRRKNFEKIIKYAELALQQPLDTLDSIEANELLAAGLDFKYRDASGKEWTAARQQIVIPYLHGLKIALDNLTQTKRVDPPGIGAFSCPDDDKSCQQLKINYQKEVAERARVDFQNHLIDDRDAILMGCIAAYAARRKNAPPPDPGELERIAKDILTPAHEDVAKKIVDEVTKTTSAREQREKSQNEQTKRDQAVFPHHPEGEPTHTKHATPVTPNNGEAPQ